MLERSWCERVICSIVLLRQQRTSLPWVLTLTSEQTNSLHWTVILKVWTQRRSKTTQGDSWSEALIRDKILKSFLRLSCVYQLVAVLKFWINYNQFTKKKEKKTWHLNIDYYTSQVHIMKAGIALSQSLKRRNDFTLWIVGDEMNQLLLQRLRVQICPSSPFQYSSKKTKKQMKDVSILLTKDSKTEK